MPPTFRNIPEYDRLLIQSRDDGVDAAVALEIASADNWCSHLRGPNGQSRHSSHPNQQLPYGRARSSFISLSFTCTLSIASAGTGRSSGNRLSAVNRSCSSSNTSSVLRQAVCWLSLISPRYNTCRCATLPDFRRRLSTTV